MKLKTLQPRLKPLNTSRVQVSQEHKTRARRVTGRRLQKRRLDIWTASPQCAACERYTQYPSGFELDHIVPLHQGGEDSESNLQVLCIECHGAKTLKEQG